MSFMKSGNSMRPRAFLRRSRFAFLGTVVHAAGGHLERPKPCKSECVIGLARCRA
jgi:hypothetical protein